MREDAELLLEYMDDLLMHAKAAMKDFDPTPYFRKYGPSGNAWAMMKHYWNDMARQVAEPVIAKYTGRLAAADVSTVDNAFTVITSLQHDDGLVAPAFGIHP